MIGSDGTADIRCANHQRELVRVDLCRSDRDTDGDTDSNTVNGMANV